MHAYAFAHVHLYANNKLTGQTTHVEVVVEGGTQILLKDTVDLIGTQTGGDEGILAVSVLVEGRLDVRHQLLVLLRARKRLVDAVDQILVGLETLECRADPQTGSEGGTGDEEGVGAGGGLDDLGGLLGGDDRGGDAGRGGQGDGGGGTGHLADFLEDLAGGGPLGAVGHLELGGEAGGAHGLLLLGRGKGGGLGGGAEKDKGGGELHRGK